MLLYESRSRLLFKVLFDIYFCNKSNDGSLVLEIPNRNVDHVLRVAFYLVNALDVSMLQLLDLM